MLAMKSALNGPKIKAKEKLALTSSASAFEGGEREMYNMCAPSKGLHGGRVVC